MSVKNLADILDAFVAVLEENMLSFGGKIFVFLASILLKALIEHLRII